LVISLTAALAQAHAEGRLEERLGFFAKRKLLIVDELGYLPFETNAAHLFFQLVSRRYERGLVLITSNRAVGEWGSVFGDPVVATGCCITAKSSPSAVTAIACARSAAPA
jgi:DNA replication protein DnaC